MGGQPNTFRPVKVDDLKPNEYSYLVIALMYFKLGWYPESEHKRPEKEPSLLNIRFEFDLDFRRASTLINRADYLWDKIHRMHLLRKGGIVNHPLAKLV